MNKTARRFLPFDAARYLVDDVAMAEYMTAVLEANSPDLLLLALGIGSSVTHPLLASAPPSRGQYPFLRPLLMASRVRGKTRGGLRKYNACMSKAAQLKSRPSEALIEHRSRIEALARAHGVSNVRVFGSAARGTDRVGSDLDLLVEPSSDTTLFDLAALQQALEELTGVPVDVRTPAEISVHIRERILSEARP